MSLITIKRSAEILPRPKRPIYWSGLGVVAAGTLISIVAMTTLEPAHAAGIVNPILVIFTAMARGFFGDDEKAKPVKKEEESA